MIESLVYKNDTVNKINPTNTLHDSPLSSRQTLHKYTGRYIVSANTLQTSSFHA